MKATRLLDPGFVWRDSLNTNVAETFARARKEIKHVQVVKLPPLRKSNAPPCAGEDRQ